ncbi:MAG: 2-oxoacid:ferredoxin oxidoreductase subunit beta [Bdellovibrionales bacterium]|nr:2-oxoacid:ferredoxin oxidoreductase subunit beta [Bdellovibrionales bacterium]
MASNELGFERNDYKGKKSTLCSGCGHDSITNHIISALFQSSVNPYDVAKLSGIGCSSKTPTYFLEKSAGFNSLHGRMAPLATGVKLVNPKLTVVGISGDGDSASIGLGGFCHLLRRNLPMVYVVENNGVYGLTKGQFSATADVGSSRKSGEINSFSSIDLCSVAIEMGCGFVARSFSGDAKQLVPLLRAALEFNGTAFIDIISPCVTFANHPGSTKSYDAVKEHKWQLQELGFIESKEEITADYEGSTVITMHDGSKLVLTKVDGDLHDVTDVMAAQKLLFEARQNQQFATGLFYFNEEKPTLLDQQSVTGTELYRLGESELRPSLEQLNEIQNQYR